MAFPIRKPLRNLLEPFLCFKVDLSCVFSNASRVHTRFYRGWLNLTILDQTFYTSLTSVACY